MIRMIIYMMSYTEVLKEYIYDKKNRFQLEPFFVEKYSTIPVKFGFNGLGEIVYLRSYSRAKENGEKEKWFETVQRVVEGTYTMQKAHIIMNNLHWDEEKSQRSAQKMYGYMFDMKFLPPGRGLWAMGTDIIYKKGLFGALNNCAFTSTEYIEENFTEPFEFMADASMQGVGVGFDTKGAGKIMIYRPKQHIIANLNKTYKIPDSREGWVESIRLLVESYIVKDDKYMFFDYTGIRPAGIPLKTFGGTSSGGDVLLEAHEEIRKVLSLNNGQTITARSIVDIMNIIGRCIVSGGVRRTAQIAFGNGQEFIELKDYSINPERQAYGWASNNTVVKQVGDDYSDIVEAIKKNGEPGIMWLENMQKFGRMGENSNEMFNVDHKVMGGNPCLEQSLEHMEMCCLVETFPMRMTNMEEFLDVLKYAYLYAKTVTLGTTNWTKTNQVMLKNRRIGTSISGIRQFMSAYGIDLMKRWMNVGYLALQEIDEKYSNWFAIPKSIKTTSIKPSGTVSLLTGSTPGIHHIPSNSKYFRRRITVNIHSPVMQLIKDRGYEYEPVLRYVNGEWQDDDENMSVIFYCDSGSDHNDTSMWEQLTLAAFVQEHWADNQISATVSFDKDREGDELELALNVFQYKLKGISFLPKGNWAYKQMPYEAIDRETYQSNVVHSDSIMTITGEDPKSEDFCNTDICEMNYN